MFNNHNPHSITHNITRHQFYQVTPHNFVEKTNTESSSEDKGVINFFFQQKQRAQVMSRNQYKNPSVPQLHNLVIQTTSSSCTFRFIVFFSGEPKTRPRKIGSRLEALQRQHGTRS